VHNEWTCKSALFSASKVILEIKNALPGQRTPESHCSDL
jgi:hypothetical protein